MAGKIFTLWGSVRADDKDLKKDLRSIEQQIGSASNKMRTSVDTAAKKMGKALGFALVAASAVAVYEMQKVGRAAIKASSDLEETTGKFNVVFKGQEAVAKQWSKTLVDSYAMSTEESKRFLSSIQDLLVPMGMNAEEAGKMSFEVTKLAADLGSFNNLPTAQVMLDIQSALVGNFETMKKYGVVLNETVVKQAALNMGLWDGKGMVDANIKAQVAYELMLRGSSAAIGDQARTMDSYANQVKSLTASYTDLLAKIGNEFLPIATQVVSMLNVWIKANKDLIASNVGDVVSQWALGLVKVLEAIQGVIFGIGLMSRAWDGVVAVAQTAIHGMTVAVAGTFEALRTLLTPLELIYAGLVKLGIVSWNPITEGLNAISKALSDVKSSTEDVMAASIKKVIETTKTYDGYDKAIQKVIDSIKDMGEETWFTMDGYNTSMANAVTATGKVDESVKKLIGTINGVPYYKKGKEGKESFDTTTTAVKETDKAVTILIGSIDGIQYYKTSSGAIKTFDELKGSVEAATVSTKDLNSSITDTGKIIEKISSKTMLLDAQIEEGKKQPLKDAVVDVKAAFDNLGERLDQGDDYVVKFSEEGSGEIINAANKILSVLQQARKTAADIYARATAGAKPGYENQYQGLDQYQTQYEGLATGGSIPGYGGGDTVPAMLERGEYVINKDAVKAYGMDTFDKLNAQKLASGGSVTPGGGLALWQWDWEKSIAKNGLEAFQDWAFRQQPEYQWQAKAALGQYMNQDTIKRMEEAVRMAQIVVGALPPGTKKGFINRSYRMPSDALEAFMESKSTPDRLPKYGTGTGLAGLPNTGLFYGHRGEIIKSPQESDEERRLELVSSSQGKTVENTYNISISPQFLTGDKASMRQAAISLKRELGELDRRWWA